jgi:hypothetical protein
MELKSTTNRNTFFMAKNYRALSFRIIIVLLFYFWHLPSFGQNTSLPKANKNLVTRYFDEVINTQMLNRMGEFFSWTTFGIK